MTAAELFNDPRITDVGILYEAADGLRSKLEPIWTAHGLSALDFTALMRLTRSTDGRLRMTDLAAQTQLSTSGTTRLVDRLERNGFTRREADPADRRSSYAVLTGSGADVVAAVLPQYLRALDRWFIDPLTPAQREALIDALRILRDITFPDAARITD